MLRITLAQFNALGERHRTERQTQDYRAGVIASLLANQWRSKDDEKPPAEPGDFFPSLPKLRDCVEPEEPWKRDLKLVRALAQTFGGVFEETAKEPS